MRFQLKLGLDDASSFYPFAYPPPFLLLVAPLGYLTYPAAAALWAAGTLALLLVAFIRLGQPRHLLTLLLLAPTTIICLVFGQNGCLFAGILLGGLRLSERRPWLGGAVLGLMICKPQLAVMLPVALLAIGRWQTIIAVGLSAAGLMALSALIFGPALLIAWPAASVTFIGIFRAGSTHLWPMMPTMTGLMLQIGAPTGWMSALQALGAMVAVVLTWRAYRSANPAAIAVLAAATFLATPYALVYDMVLLTAALLWVLPDSPSRLPTAKIALLAVVLCAPMLMLNGWPVGLFALLAALLLARSIGQERSPTACPAISWHAPADAAVCRPPVGCAPVG